MAVPSTSVMPAAVVQVNAATVIWLTFVSVVGADLEGRGVRRGQDVLAVELRAAQRAGRFLGQLHELFVQAGAVGVAVGAVGGLHRQFTHALEDVAHLAQRAFSGLRQRDRVIGVAGGHAHAAHCAFMRSAMARPAASSLAPLTRRPEDRRCIEVAREDWLVLRLRCALSDTRLVLMVWAMKESPIG
jgi:hypothetical protein